MKKSQSFQPNNEAIERLQQEVRFAAEAYFRAASEHNEAIETARAQGWNLNSDGRQSLHLAARLERHQLEKYAHLVNALKDAVCNARQPTNRRNTRAKKLTGRPLTPRESEILKLIAEGHSSREVAEKLKISFRTAVAHRYHIMWKLDIHDVVTLVRYALRNKLVEL